MKIHDRFKNNEWLVMPLNSFEFLRQAWRIPRELDFVADAVCMDPRHIGSAASVPSEGKSMEQLEYYLSAFGFKVGELSRHPLPDGLFTQSNSRYGWLIPEITAHEDDVTRLARKNIYKEFFSITEEPPLVSPVMSYENFVKSGKRHPDIILPKNPVYVDINTMGDDEKFSAIKAFVAVMGNDPQFKKLATPALEKITDGKTQDSIIQSFVRAVTNDPRFENQASPALKKALQTITAEYVAKLGNP